MAGDDPDAAKFTGLAKHFNTMTLQGRANITKATVGLIGLAILITKYKPSSKKDPK